MAAASSSNAPVGGESASDEESVRSDDQHSAVSSSGLDSDEEFGVGCESREASESDASHQDGHSAADESADDLANDEDDAADEATPNQCVLCTRPLRLNCGISFRLAAALCPAPTGDRAPNRRVASDQSAVGGQAPDRHGRRKGLQGSRRLQG